MRRFFRQNFVLLLGILLPIGLVVFFWVASLMPTLLIKPPKYDLLYMTSPYPHDGVHMEVVNGKLKISVSPQVKKGQLPMPRLFLFDAKTQTSKELPIEVPPLKKTNASKREELILPEIQKLTLDPKETAPDGYKAELSSPHINSTISFFLVSSYKRSFLISKAGNSINISDEKNEAFGYKTVRFLGWIIPQ